jgi:hypothetical protein
VLENGSVAIKVNNVIGHYFLSHKEVRHEDPFSPPILFNVVVDVLTKMVYSCQQNNMITGLASHLIPNGIAILQYADDTILCLEDDMDKVRNVKLLLYMFERWLD